MLRYFFGGEEDTASLKNEPTIDYNDTVFTNTRGYSRAANDYEPARRTTDAFEANRPGLANVSSTKIPAVIDFSDDELDSDEDMTRDFNVIMNNFTRTGDSFSKYNAGADGTNYSLPSDYPGKFRPTTARESNFQPKYEPVNTYGNQYLPRKSIDLDQYERVRSSTAPERNYADYSTPNEDYRKPKEDPEYTLQIDQQINELQKQVDKDFHAKSLGEEQTDAQIKAAMEKIRHHNEFLGQLNELVDINNSPAEQQNIPHNLYQKYQEMKRDYINELNSSQLLYKGYCKLILKYRQLRKQTSSTSATPTQPKNKSSFTIREKVRLIRSTTTQESIKLICANILRELDGLESVEHYKQELEVANLKIQELEQKLKSQEKKS